MTSPEFGEVPQRRDVRSLVRRGHTVTHVVVALLLVGAVALPIWPRLVLAAVCVLAAAALRLGPSLPNLSRTELVPIVNVIVGFLAFLILPEVPLISLGFTGAGLVAATVVAHPVLERLIVALAVVFEVAKVPIVVSADFTASLPFLSEFFRHPTDVIVGSLLQSAAVFVGYGIGRAAIGALRGTQQDLVESESRYRVLTEALPDAALVAADGRIAFANRAAQDMLGDIALSVEGQYLDEVISPDLLPGLKEAVGRSLREGTPCQVEGRPMGDSTNAIHLNASLSPLDFDGRSAVMIVITDRSDHYAAEQARREGEARFRSAFLNTATPFVLLTPEAKVLDLNDAAVRLLGYPYEDAMGRNWDTFVERGNVAEIREFLATAAVGMVNHLNTEATLIPRSGGPIRSEIDYAVDRDSEGSLRNYVVQVHDVTERHEAQEALRLGEERYRSLFERNPIALYRTKADGEIVDVNLAMLDLLGYTSKDHLVALSASDVYVDPAVRDSIRTTLQESGELQGYEWEIIRADGSTLWVRDTARMFDVDGQLYFEGSLVDVTARRRADALLRRAAVQGETVAKLGQFALATAVVDELFAETVKSMVEVLDISTAAILLPAEHGGYESAAAIGWPGTDEHSFRDRLEALVGFAAEATRPVVVNPPEEDRTDAVESAVAIAVRGSGDLLGVLLAVDRDGRAFRPDGLHLLRSVANVLAAAIDRHASRSQLEQLVRSKDEFIASISHELRTPLTVVAGMAHELQDQWDQFESDEIEELISLMVDQSDDMRNLIEDLLVAARADIGKVSVHMVPVDVPQAIDALLSALPPRNGAVINSDLHPVTAVADPTRVRQIVRNLLTNALRYGGPVIWVSAGVDDGRAFIRVHDNGPGIPPDRQDQIFEPYESVHQAVGMPGSVGLGLTISRKLARLMSGDLTYRIADGSLFELSLELAPDAGALPSPVDGDHEIDTPLSWSSILS